MTENSNFNWREYVSLPAFEHSRYYDSKGKLLPNYADRKDLVEYRKLELQIVTATLDQISQIPQVQEWMRKSLPLGEERLRQNSAMYGDAMPDDKRLELSLSLEGKGAHYKTNEHRLVLNTEALIHAVEKTKEGGQADISLQEAIMHELVHAADPTITPELDLAMHKKAASTALEKMLDDYPQYRESYKQTGLIEGLPIRTLLQATNYANFHDVLNVIKNSDESIFKEDLDIKPEVERRAGSNMKHAVSLYLQNAYERAYNAEAETTQELPAIETVNPLLKGYFGLPERQGYITTSEKKGIHYIHTDEEYPLLAAKLKEIANHPLILPPVPEAALKCGVEAVKAGGLLAAGCADVAHDMQAGPSSARMATAPQQGAAHAK